MSKHTPGPWVIDPCFDIIAINEVDVGCNGMVASVCTEVASIGIAEANARLIAAAPELLQAMRAFLISGIGNSTHYELQAEAHRLARAAIAKATGAA